MLLMTSSCLVCIFENSRMDFKAEVFTRFEILPANASLCVFCYQSMLPGVLKKEQENSTN